MTEYVGGTRLALVNTAVFNFVDDILTQQRWYETTGNFTPATLVPEPIDESVGQEDVAPNTISVASENTMTFDDELGSNLINRTRLWFIDIYAESKSIGERICSDLLDALEYRFAWQPKPVEPYVSVIDALAATPTEIFKVYITNPESDYTRHYTHTYRRHWYQIGFELVDQYDIED